MGDTEREESNGSQYRVQAVDRAIDILQAFTMTAATLSLAEVAKRAGLSKPTAFRLLSTLQNRGFVAQTPQGYMLGSELSALAASRGRAFGLLDHSLPVMRSVRDALDETVSLGIRAGDYRVQLHQEQSFRELRRVTHEGDRSPLHAGAANKLLMAAMRDDEIDDYLARVTLAQFTPNTTTDPTALRQELNRIRDQGWAESREEKHLGGASVAHPLRDAHGAVVGALYVSVPISRFTAEWERTCDRQLAEGAARISESLGFRARPDRLL